MGVSVVAVEDVIMALNADLTDSENYSQAIGEITQKYIRVASQ